MLTLHVIAGSEQRTGRPMARGGNRVEATEVSEVDLNVLLVRRVKFELQI